MANMSYCRFENTIRDLRDCFDNMDDNDLSKSEFKYRNMMIAMCMEIADQYEYLLDDEWIEELDEEDDDLVELERE